MEGKWVPRVLESRPKIVRIGCRSRDTCPFRINCTYRSQVNIAKVTLLKPRHECLGSAPVIRDPHARVDWLVREIPKLLQVTPSTNVKTIQDVILRRYRVSVDVRQIQRAKASLVEQFVEDLLDDFGKIPGYLQRPHDANFGRVLACSKETSTMSSNASSSCRQLNRGLELYHSWHSTAPT